jgi:hypothetical protein
MANPTIPQGVLNRIYGSITCTSFPILNITAPYLGKQMIGLTFDTPSTTAIETSTGLVMSPEPYQRVTINAHLIRTQSLVNAWKVQLEASSLIGDLTIRGDTPNLNPYQISNSAIMNVDRLLFNGSEADWVINLVGIYYINSALWST